MPSSDERDERLAMLEATLVGAAAARPPPPATTAPQRHPGRRGRAARAPRRRVGGQDRGLPWRGSQSLGATGRPPRSPGLRQRKARASAAGAGPRDRESERSWQVGTQRVIGYTTPSGRFCFRFVALTGGCLSRDTLTAARPLGPHRRSSRRRRAHLWARDGRCGRRHCADILGDTTRSNGPQRLLCTDEFTRRPGRIYAYPRRTSPRWGIQADARPGTETESSLPNNALPVLPGALSPVEDTAA